ncbi:DUF4179 domain-containing protein [Bacillus sp. B-jedd]|uniref:DUF4179 domain-containing protein n=1 Tax=Bacillus sp. B-jedd TaxID=1476857 RepID=UPI00051569E7|nr:DUF4179 domain-containing protein [Bacillus sp. B-jedd]CEG25541.1 hypothetical protein BN1002_00353 [Bacillus sp. B-jedd]
MHNPEEEKLADYKRFVDGLPVPEDLLDSAIMAGFEKGKIEKKRSRRWMKAVFSVAAAAVMLIGFFTSIRLSPAFAGYVSELPGFAKIVDLIQGDKGIIAALESEYDQEIGAASTKNGVTFTVTRAIADETGLVLFYTIDTLKERQEINLNDVQLKGTDGKRFALGSFSFGNHANSVKGEKSFAGTLEFQFTEPLEARAFNLKVNIEGTEHEVDFNLTKEISAKKEYVLNKTVEIEGQKVTFEKVEIYPLRVAIHVKMDPANTKRLLNFDQIRLVDEHGETWNKISNGITATGGPADEKRVLYVQSNYFKEPEKLYLIPGKIQALDKNDAYMIVDTEKKQILKQPQPNKYYGVRVEDGYLWMRIKGEFHYFPFSSMKDADGKDIERNGGDTSYGEQVTTYGEGYTEHGIGIAAGKNVYKNPLKLEIAFYPAWIESQEKVRIK